MTNKFKKAVRERMAKTGESYQTARMHEGGLAQGSSSTEAPQPPFMRPLKQWYCDTCGDIIERAEEGGVEWENRPTLRVSNFRIVHNTPGSDCYRVEGGSWMPISDMLGAAGQVRMLQFIDQGAFHRPDYDGPRVDDLRNWTEVYRRLHLPHYEEARRYFDAYREDADGINEVALYMPETLRGIIEDYGDSEDNVTLPLTTPREQSVTKMTDDDMAALLGSVNDDEENHVLWVDPAGNLHLTRITALPRTPGELQFRLESFGAGNRYCGPHAARDAAYVAKTLNALRRLWADGRKGYIDFW